MKIKYADGNEVEVESEDEAREVIGELYPLAEYGEWEPDPFGGWERMLVWVDEGAAAGDDGQQALAEIISR